MWFAVLAGLHHPVLLYQDRCLAAAPCPDPSNLDDVRHVHPCVCLHVHVCGNGSV